MTPTPAGKIVSIVYRPLDRPYPEGRKGDFIRVPLAEARLVEGHGIDGDAKAGGRPDRQLNVLSREWLETMAGRGFRGAPGEFGEQLIVSGLDLDSLQPGARLRVGDEAVIEMSQPRHGCERLKAAQNDLDARPLGTIGILARVITGGTIRVGDGVVPG